MSIKDSLKRLIALVEDNQSSLDECEKVVLPPVYELLCRDLEYALSTFDFGDIPWIDSLKTLAHKVAPVYYTYIATSVLPYSKVGKIGCVGYRNHSELLQSLRGRIVAWYELSPTQLSKKTLSSAFPIVYGIEWSPIDLVRPTKELVCQQTDQTRPQKTQRLCYWYTPSAWTRLLQTSKGIYSNVS